MGYIKHNAIIVTGSGYPEAMAYLKSVHAKAKELFGNLVTEIIPSNINDYHSFFVAPDGSKEGWDESDEKDTARSELFEFIDSYAYDDGSNSIHYVDVSYDEQYEVEIERTNPYSESE